MRSRPRGVILAVGPVAWGLKGHRRKGSDPMSDLFVSYSPADADFVAELARELSEHELDARIDCSGDADDSGCCSAQAAEAVASCDAVLFVVRAESFTYPARTAELELAFSHNKRVIPLVREDPAAGQVPDQLEAVRWIPADGEPDLRKLARALLHTLREELRAARAHRARSVRLRRRRWRERLQPRWNASREPILALVALAALVLGTIGYLQAPGQHYTFLDSFYRALQLYGFGGAVAFKVPAALQIARILAPFALGFAAVRAIFHLFADELQVLRIRLFAHNHVVIVGLGSSGSHAVKSFYDEGWMVVAVERDPDNHRVAAIRDLGVPVLIGDARDSAPLRRARIARARYLLVTSGEDGINFDVAMTAADHVRGRSRLTAFVHIRDLRLWRELKARSVAVVNGSPFRWDAFNVYFTAAHLLIDRFPPFQDDEGNELEDPHVCIIGLDGVGEGLVLRIASTWRTRHPDRKLRLTIAGPAADVAHQALVLRRPILEEICELGARPMDISSEAFVTGGALLDEHGQCDVTMAYVALETQAESLAAAFGLHGAPQTAHVPVVVTLEDGEGGTARALDGTEGLHFATGVQPFGVLSSALTPAIALQGTSELIARQRHQDWMQARLTEGKPSDATVPWDELREEYKEANRSFAAAVGTALAEAGCELAPAPLSIATEGDFTFTDAEVEILARHEHEHWVQYMREDGWHLEAQKNLTKRAHPHLVPWDQLPTDVRGADIEEMKNLPRILAAVGLKVYRPNTGAGSHGLDANSNGRAPTTSPVEAPPLTTSSAAG